VPPPPPSPILVLNTVPNYAETVVGDQVEFTAIFSNSPPASVQWLQLVSSPAATNVINTGVVNVANLTTLALSGGGQTGGTFTISSGGTLAYQGGTYNLAGATMNNSGSITFPSNTTQFTGTTASLLAGNVNINGGTLQINNSTTLGAAFTLGANGKYFSGANTVDFANRFTVLELEELKGRKHLQRVVLLHAIYQIQQAMYLGDRDCRKIVIIDEAWDLLSEGDVAKFIEAAYRRVRKYNGSAIAITQSPLDLEQSQTGRAVRENSAWHVYLGQKARRSRPCIVRASSR